VAILDLIEFPDESGREMVHRVPEYGSGEFRLGSQLVVRESQAAIFFRDGKALDVFGAGRHTLSTNNIPILSSLFGIPFGGKSPFRAEVYFVSLREFLDLKWGTPQPILFRDTDFGMVRLRAFGTYTMRIADPQMFVNTIVGQQGVYDTNQIQDYLRGVIVQELTTILGETMKSVLDLPVQFNTVASATRASVLDDFANLGLELRGFQLVSVTPPEEVQKFIDQRSAMGALGNMNQYTQFQTAQAIRDAANNPGELGGAQGAGLGAGMGMGMGMAMMDQMRQAMQGGQGGQGTQQVQQPPQQAPVAPAGGTTVVGATRACPNCQAQVPAGAKFCQNCGNAMPAAQVFCTECGTANQAGAKFCQNCGKPLGG
jgi:membrane protease subunit (stomatin/prohibitin family)